MIRVTPGTGTEIQRKATVAANLFLPSEINTTRDQKRVFFGGNTLISGGIWLGSVADETSMRALNTTSSRGCWPMDQCYRTDTGTVFQCISNNGGLLADWKEFGAGGSVSPQSANLVFSGPSSGSSATPTFRSLVVDDLPGSDVGKALLSLTDPSAITFLRINADNSVSALNASDFLTAIGSSSSGDVVGPSSSTDNALARWDLATGQLLQDSTAILTDTGSLGLNTSPGNASLFVLKGGTATTVTTTELLVLQNNASAGDSLNILGVAGTTGTAGILFGTAGNHFQGGLKYNNTNDSLDIFANGAAEIKVLQGEFRMLYTTPRISFAQGANNINSLSFQSSTTNAETYLNILPNGSAANCSILLYGGADPDASGQNIFGFGGGFTGAVVGSWSFGSINKASASSDSRPISFVLSNSSDGRFESFRLANNGSVQFRFSKPEIQFATGGGLNANALTFRGYDANTTTFFNVCPNGSAIDACALFHGNSDPDASGHNMFGIGSNFGSAVSGSWNIGSFNYASPTSNSRPISFTLSDTSGRYEALRLNYDRTIWLPNVPLTTGLTITTATKSFPLTINGTVVNVLCQ